jgi:uncharacterized protein (DUF58 family)
MTNPAIDQSRIEKYGSLEFLARQVVEGFITGLHKSPLHGFSVEFAEHRLYNAGESTKHIDWKLYGKTDKLFVKKFEEETNLRCQIIIDNSSSMYFPFKKNIDSNNLNKITFSIYSAAAIMYLLRKQRDATGLSVYSDKLEEHTQCKSTYSHHKYLYTILEKMLVPISADVRKQTSTASILHLIAESIHKRSLIVIFSDMFENVQGNDEVFKALQHLRHNKNEVVLFHVVDKSKEIDFDYNDRPYKFIDVETNKEVKINPSEIKEYYNKKIKEFEKSLKMKCNQYHIDFIEADINRGFDAVLDAFFIKRMRML